MICDRIVVVLLNASLFMKLQLYSKLILKKSHSSNMIEWISEETAEHCKR